MNVEICREIVVRVAATGRYVHHQQLRGGLSATTTAITYDDEDARQRCIVRQLDQQTIERNPAAAREQFRVLGLLASLGVKAPTPLYVDESCMLLPTPYIVIGFLEGKPNYNPHDPGSFARQVAQQLAKLHTIREPEVDLSFLRDQSTACMQRIHHPRYELPAGAPEHQIRAFLDEKWPLPNQPPRTLLHGDCWAGNILWQDDELIAFIDWEDASAGNPLYELAVSRLDFWLIFGREAMETFTQHYLAFNPIELTQLPYWELAVSLRSEGHISHWAGDWPELGRPDITAQSMRDVLYAFVDDAFARIDAPS